MKLLKSIFVIVLAAAMMCSCWRLKVWENDFPSYKVNATVKYYFNLNRENSYSLDYNTLVVAVDDNGLKIDMFLWGTDIEASIVDFALGKGTAERYAELREEFGDFNPDASNIYVPTHSPVSPDALFEDVCEVAGPARYGWAICEKICALTVTSSADWDAAHPAGASLNDLFEIEYETIYPMIKQGFPGVKPGFLGNWITHVQKPLNNLAEDDLWLCTNYEFIPAISTTSLPVIGGTHTIFVTLTLDTGEKIEYSTDCTFE